MSEIVELTSDESSSDEGAHADGSTSKIFQYPAIVDRVCVQGIGLSGEVFANFKQKGKPQLSNHNAV